MQDKSYILLYISRLEKLVYNNKMLEDALFKRNFKISDKKYYLTNAKYHNMDYFLYFYCGIYYYFKK